MLRALALLLTVASLAGCTFSRTVVNGHVRTMDTSWIEPGKTTKGEIVRRLGIPPSLVGAKGVRPGSNGAIGTLLGQTGAGAGTPAVGMEAEGNFAANAARTFRWTTSDTVARMFEGGWIVYPTFSRSLSTRSHDIFIRFDEKDVVQLVSRTELRDGVTRVLEWREADR